MFTKTKIINRLFKDIKDNELIEDGDTLILAASGGPDSQFLIYSLYEIKKNINFDIILCHLNHLHRDDAIKDEDLVIATAKKLNLKYYIERKSMDDLARKLKISPEDAGRRLRYGFFRQVMTTYDKSKIALAHNRDDQAETVLMRIIRGTGLDGLMAMQFKSNDLIRPILNFSKKEILEYLDHENIPYNLDYTNLETDYTRNKLRLEIIPQIEKINPSFKDSLINLSLIAKDEVSIIKEIENESFFNICQNHTDKLVSFKRKEFEKTSYPLQARLIRKAVEIISGTLKDFSKSNIDDFIGLTSKESGKKIQKDNIIFQKNYYTYDLYIEKTKKSDDIVKYIGSCDEIRYKKFIIRTQTVSKEFYLKTDKKNKVFFDKKFIKFPLTIRTRKDGDRFNAFSNGKRKKLKDFFIDMKIDRDKRNTIPLILSEDKIIWIAPFRRSDDYKVESDTEEILMISLEEV